jgi:hypothetical protein
MQLKAAELEASDALLLGRKTSEGFAKAWPSMRETTGAFGATPFKSGIVIAEYAPA